MKNRPSVVLAHEQNVQSAAFSRDGSTVVTGTGDEHVSYVRLWCTRGKPKSEPLRQGQLITHIQFSPDGSCFITCDKAGTAQLRSAESGQPLCEPFRHKKEVWGAAFHPNRPLVVTASEDKTIRVWDYPRGKSVGVPIKLPKGSSRPRFNGSGDYFTAVIGGKQLFVWPFDRPEEPLVLDHPAGSTHVVWSPDGQTLATCGKDRRLRLWSIPAGKLLDDSFKAEQTDLTSAAYLPDGQTIILGSHFFSSKAMFTEIFGWDVASRRSTFCERYEKEVWYVSTVALDGRHFLSGAWAKTTRLMRTADGKTVTEFAPQMDPPVSVKRTTFSPDGRQILICAGTTAQIWSGL